MDKAERTKLMLEYLRMLQDGRARPDKHGGGSVREANDNRPDIDAVKDAINNEFGLYPDRDDPKYQNKKRSSYE